MKVKAIKPCFYGTGREPGEVFEAQGRFASALIRLGRVVEVAGAKALRAEEPGADAPKRTYKRKDMAGVGETK